LFEAYLNAHKGQVPKTFYTDQDAAMGKAVGEVFAEAWHGLCTFHIMQNTAKHLHKETDEEKKKEKKKVKEKEKEKEKRKGKK
jgi:zinc finger SWIM domain-containing protein 3